MIVFDAVFFVEENSFNTAGSKVIHSIITPCIIHFLHFHFAKKTAVNIRKFSLLNIPNIYSSFRYVQYL